MYGMLILTKNIMKKRNKIQKREIQEMKKLLFSAYSLDIGGIETVVVTKLLNYLKEAIML